jgi:antirestriction protein ArdC
MQTAPDYIAEVMSSVADQLENGLRPWIPKWSRQTAADLAAPLWPQRADGEDFHGFNAMILYMAIYAHGRNDPRYLTLKQGNSAGARLRPGSKGIKVLLVATTKKEDAANDNTQGAVPAPRIYTRTYHVFSAEDFDGLAPLVPPSALPSPNHRINAWVRQSNVKLCTHTDTPCYVPKSDAIYLPPKGSFASEEGYLSTLLHELGHATGADSRTGRFSHTAGLRLEGREAYAFEELCAELFVLRASACLRLPVSAALLNNHSAYISAWASLLRDKPNLLAEAQRQAEGALTWLTASQQVITAQAA